MFVKTAALAAILMSTTPLLAPLASAGTIRLCTGAPNGNYDFVGISIAKQAEGSALNVVLVPSKGSLDNLAKLDAGKCDAAIAQNDAFGVYEQDNPHSTLNIERATDLYPEYVHLLCNPQSGVHRVQNLTAKDVLITGPNGGGTAVTWQSFATARPKKYGAVQTAPIGSMMRALAKVQDGTDAQCMMAVSGLKSPAMEEADAMSAETPGSLRLVPADATDLLSIMDARGKPLYAEARIPARIYPKGLLPDGGVNTLTVESLVVANSTYADNNDDDYTAFLTDVEHALPTIRQRTERQ
jgi:TRAP transporter TAXI family solute receptor